MLPLILLVVLLVVLLLLLVVLLRFVYRLHDHDCTTIMTTADRNDSRSQSPTQSPYRSQSTPSGLSWRIAPADGSDNTATKDDFDRARQQLRVSFPPQTVKRD